MLRGGWRDFLCAGGAEPLGVARKSREGAETQLETMALFAVE